MRKAPYTPRGLRRCRCVRCHHRRASRQIENAGVYYPLCDDCALQFDLLVVGFLRIDQRITLAGSVKIQEEVSVSMKRGELTAIPSMATLEEWSEHCKR